MGNITHQEGKLQMILDNPSYRIICDGKRVLDEILKQIEDARKRKKSEVGGNVSFLLNTLLNEYIAFRRTFHCKGCKKGAEKCVHWSLEEVEINGC